MLPVCLDGDKATGSSGAIILKNTILISSSQRTLWHEDSHRGTLLPCQFDCIIVFQHSNHQSSIKHAGKSPTKLLKQVSKRCTYIRNPHHKLKHMRERKCGQFLMKTYLSPSGGKLIYPYKQYCYKSVKSSLEMFWRKLWEVEIITSKWRGIIWCLWWKSMENFSA